MSQLTDAMTALGKAIAAKNDPTLAPHLAAIDAHLSSIDTKQGADEATIADTTAGLQALLTAAQGTTDTTTGTPAPTQAPGA